jgi:outer membrane cobalamin receptor
VKIRLALLTACIAAAAAALPAAAQTTPPAPADSVTPPATATPPARRVPRNPNLITRAEIEANGGRTAFELVNRLRPRWFRPSAASMGAEGEMDPIYVYLDGARVGPAQRELHRISAEQIAEIRYIPSQEAVARWGAHSSSGVIMITSR